MPLGTEVGLGPGNIVFRWGPSPESSKKRGTAGSSLFGLCLLLPKGRPSQLLLSSCCQSFRYAVFDEDVFTILKKSLLRDDGITNLKQPVTLFAVMMTRMQS